MQVTVPLLIGIAVLAVAIGKIVSRTIDYLDRDDD